MAISKMVARQDSGVDRPALSAVFPTLQGTPVVLVDVGANVDCSPDMLAQFAVMGDIYSRVIFHTGGRAWACFPSAKKSTRAMS